MNPPKSPFSFSSAELLALPIALLLGAAIYWIVFRRGKRSLASAAIFAFAYGAIASLGVLLGLLHWHGVRPAEFTFDEQVAFHVATWSISLQMATIVVAAFNLAWTCAKYLRHRDH